MIIVKGLWLVNKKAGNRERRREGAITRQQGRFLSNKIIDKKEINLIKLISFFMDKFN